MRVQLFKAFLHALQCEPCSVSTSDAYKANIFGVCFVLWVFSVPNQEIGWEELMKLLILCRVEWDVKPCSIAI